MLSEESRMLDLCIRKDLRKNKVCIEKYCSDTAGRFTVVTLSARIRLIVTLCSFWCLTHCPWPKVVTLAQGEASTWTLARSLGPVTCSLWNLGWLPLYLEPRTPPL